MTNEAGLAAEASTPNMEQIRFWNSIAGPRWVRRQDMLDAQLEQITPLAIDAAEASPGNAVLDVGCGCGTSTLELSSRVGARGRVVGIDVSEPMLECARERARQAGAANVTFVCGDAQVHPFRGDFDVVFSRFGVMFFEDTEAAFRNIATALRQRGRLAFVCWQALQKNPWMLVPLMAARKHVAIEPPASPYAPGPFALADGDRTRAMLERAGFRDIGLRGVDIEMPVGGGAGLDEAVEFVMELGPVERALTEATADLRETVRREIRSAFATYDGPAGVRTPASAWIVTASR